ncbi:PQQ-binding-like beta-propeller repeat protein [Phaeovulum sp.]|uniref:outer membrane protein assembly factor BamB family protein n=1 Tax=Phaeovulum sp. TaxID=2934796 RepID=UPI00356A7CD4
MKLSVGLGLATLGVLVLVSGCSKKELILPGERVEPRAILQGDTGSITAPIGGVTAVPIRVPAQVANAEWTHRGGTPSHAITNPALGDGTTLVWSASIGEGVGRKHRITADPVVGAGRVYTLDSRATVAATSTAGAPFWQVDLTPVGDRADDASGGGLAFAADKVFVTTGFGELIALDAASGAIVWRQRFDAGIGGAPTVYNNIVYVVARDASGWAIRADDGKLVWRLPGTPASSGVTGVSAPAVNAQLAIFPFASGEMIAVLRQRGYQLWSATVGGERLGRAYAIVSDLTGDPVIVGNRVYAGSSAGRAVAIDMAKGERIWTANEGANGPMQVVGDAVFLVSDEAQLVRLDAATGRPVWAVDMPYFLAEKPKKFQEIHVHYGPVLAGGRLFVASSDELLRVFDPASGAMIGSAEIPGGAASAPVVAGSTLFVVNADGQLLAFR